MQTFLLSINDEAVPENEILTENYEDGEEKDDKEIFSLNEVQRFLENDVITLSFEIPLVSDKKFDEYMVIAAPTTTGKYTSLTNKKLVQKIAIDSTNDTIFFPDDSIKVTDAIYDEVEVTKLCEWPCLNSIISQTSLGFCNNKKLCIKTKIFFEF